MIAQAFLVFVGAYLMFISLRDASWFEFVIGLIVVLMAANRLYCLKTGKDHIFQRKS
ncbi:hypothetical protein [Thalassotalea agarivorans]|uniref:Uncharacterized protein n=1 Tax=Thalassotalea agarivorans TaxID=349064 RepID=A0A1I0EP20_THASX|nr:hypothetical protein [Thalassotalea agarivorans]SET46774.1 hypothetical protein SAMN05660429_01867 [Thalassotalea agarivorans]